MDALRALFHVKHVRAREYRLLEEAVEVGVSLGWQHAHKHDTAPSEDAICAHIVEDVLTEICERFMFDERQEAE